MQDEESSYSSSYSSFFKTDTGSGSNDDSNTVDGQKTNDKKQVRGKWTHHLFRYIIFALTWTNKLVNDDGYFVDKFKQK